MGNMKRLVALVLTAAMSFSACGEGLSAVVFVYNKLHDIYIHSSVR